MSEIARFYGFTVSMDNTFTGNPNIFIDYEEDNIRGHFDLEKGEFTDAVFPQYLVKVIMEWIGDHIQVLKANMSLGQYEQASEYLNGLERDLTMVDTVLKTGIRTRDRLQARSRNLL